MTLRSTYDGSADPFLGDQTIWLPDMPVGARVTRATIRLWPQVPPDQTRFLEPVRFDTKTGQGQWGATSSTPAAGATAEITVDLGTRRTIAAITAAGTNEVTDLALAVEANGQWIEIAADGSPYVEGKKQLRLSLPQKNPDNTPPPDILLLPITAQKLKLTAEDAKTFLLYGLSFQTMPTNISLRLGDQAPFWAVPGEMASAQTSPNFASALNTFLVTATADASYTAVPLTIHSDMIARLALTLTMDYVVEQSLLPDYLPEVTLPYGYSSLPEGSADLLTLRLPQGAQIVATSGSIQGVFESSRVVAGSADRADETQTRLLSITPANILAQPLQLPAETPVQSIDLPLKTTHGKAVLRLDIQADADGQPSGQVLISAPVQVSQSPSGNLAWLNVSLPAEFRLAPDKRYWLVVQSELSKAHWEAQTGDTSVEGVLASSDQGRSWRPVTAADDHLPFQARFRLRHVPEQFSMPVELQAGSGPAATIVRFDEFAPTGKVALDLGAVAHVEQQVARAAPVLACGSGELLTNGDFEEPGWPPDTSPACSRCIARVPYGWEGVPGQIVHFWSSGQQQSYAVLHALTSTMLPECEKQICFTHNGLLNNLTGEAVEIAQLVAVRPCCSYRLAIDFRIAWERSKRFNTPEPKWRLVWLDADAVIISTAESAIDLADCQSEAASNWLTLRRYKLDVVAPENARQVRFCLIQRPPGALLLEKTSLKPAATEVHNIRLAQTSDTSTTSTPHGSRNATAETVNEADEQAVQIIEVQGGACYELRVVMQTPQPAGDQALPDEQRPRLELRWMNELPIGLPVTLYLDRRVFPPYIWRGMAPEQATHAELQLIQLPGQPTIVLTSVTLTRSDLVSLPLVFRAEAPGTLKISNLRVCYELPGQPSSADLAASKTQQEIQAAAASSTAVRLPMTVPAALLPPAALARSALAAMPASSISGVDRVLETLLTRIDVTSVTELAALDLQRLTPEAPVERLRKARVKARMALAEPLNAEMFAELADESPNDLLLAAPDDLVSLDGPDHAAIATLQRALRRLHLALKPSVFQDLRLSDITASSEPIAYR